MDYYPDELVYARTATDFQQDYNLPDSNRKFGPSLSAKMFLKHHVFAYYGYTRMFYHEYANEHTPLQIAFLSPLALPFCRHCGKVFRNAETFQQHLGDKKEHPYCSRLQKPRNDRSMRIQDPGPNREPTLFIARLSNAEKESIYNHVSQNTFTFDDICNLNVPLRLKVDETRPPSSQGFVLPRGDITVVPFINPRAIVFSEKTLYNTTRDTPTTKPLPRDVPKKTPTIRPLPRDVPTNFVLTTECIHIPKLDKWKRFVFGRDEESVKHVALVACDETTAFGCMMCGSFGVGGAGNRKCVANCFWADESTKQEQERVKYKMNYLANANTNDLICKFAEISDLQVFHDNTVCTGFQKKFWKDCTQKKRGPKPKKLGGNIQKPAAERKNSDEVPPARGFAELFKNKEVIVIDDTDDSMDEAMPPVKHNDIIVIDGTDDEDEGKKGKSIEAGTKSQSSEAIHEDKKVDELSPEVQHFWLDYFPLNDSSRTRPNPFWN